MGYDGPDKDIGGLAVFCNVLRRVSSIFLRPSRRAVDEGSKMSITFGFNHRHLTFLGLRIYSSL